MTEIVPDLELPENTPLWADTEAAKRSVLSSLARWGWFGDRDDGLRPTFRLLSERTEDGPQRVVMGHANGVVTLNVTEASESALAERRELLGELYRTMVGHIRHELAHFLFMRLSETSGFVEGFRALFGDESTDYAEALAKHYEAPRPPGDAFVTSYAAAHPHEDWAETVAHVLHLIDVLDSAAAAGLCTNRRAAGPQDVYSRTDIETLLEDAIDLTLSLNHVNRSMDLPDLYPFVLTDAVKTKMIFAHQALSTARWAS